MGRRPHRLMPDPLIVCDAVEFSYIVPSPLTPDARVLRGLSLAVHTGEHLAIIGPNGSGKSTLARHLNALLRPQRGTVRVRGMDTQDPAGVRMIRRTVGMVFQHPESQMVATIVEEDVAFGPENLGVPRPELRQRVRERAAGLVDVTKQGVWSFYKLRADLPAATSQLLAAAVGVGKARITR